MNRLHFIKKGMAAAGAILIAPPLIMAQTNQSMDTIKTAKELLLGYLENINDPDKAIQLFADDAAIELPYLDSLGMPWRWEGKAVLYNFLKNLPKTFPGFTFQNIRIHIDTPDQAFGEYDARCRVASTGFAYNQTYMGRLVAEHGRIKLLREALDITEVARKMFSNGIQALETLKKQ